MLVSAGLPVSANAINKDVGVHTKVSLNVRYRVVSPSPHRRKNCVSRNQAQTLAHERVTRHQNQRPFHGMVEDGELLPKSDILES